MTTKHLPCYPCPHFSVCCSHGTSLIGDEAQKIIASHGEESVVWDEGEKEFRTSIKDGSCFFLKNNSCSIHDKEFYPKVCASYPYNQVGTNNPYQYEITCPSWKDK